jgi:CHASE3 domain sensor protein
MPYADKLQRATSAHQALSKKYQAAVKENEQLKNKNEQLKATLDVVVDAKETLVKELAKTKRALAAASKKPSRKPRKTKEDVDHSN